MPRTRIDDGLMDRRARLAILLVQNGAQLGHAGAAHPLVVVAVRDAQRAHNSLDIGGHAEQAGVCGEGAVDEGFVGVIHARLGRVVGELDSVWSAPAEAGDAEPGRHGLGLSREAWRSSADGAHKGLDAGPRRAGPVVVEEGGDSGDGGPEGPESLSEPEGRNVAGGGAVFHSGHEGFGWRVAWQY